MLPVKKWKVLNTNTNLSLIDILLKNRNLNDDHLKKFKLSDRLHDPYLMRDMDKAVKRILAAIELNESIAIFGDYDVDGIVSTVLMIKLFKKINYPVQYFIPDRQKDGYGLKPQGIKKVIDSNVKLLITVDNGISSHEAIDIANKNEIDVIITDHHLQQGKLPEAYAVINPNQKDCEYPFKGLCGAGVVYKLLHALGNKLFAEEEFKNFMLSQLDLIALATLADVMPIRDENYALLKFGLKSLTQTMRPGIVELKRVSGNLGKEVTPMSVGFYLAPRLNAAGRLTDANLAAELLLSETKEEASKIANQLNSLNTKRQQIQDKCINQAIESISSNDLENNRVLIVENKTWNSGLLGLISGRLKEMYMRPVIAFTQDVEGNFIGSARSIDNFHITEALGKYESLYLNFGGHQKAAGLTIPVDKFSQFKTIFTNHVNSTLNSEDLIQELIIDSVVNHENINESTLSMMNEIGPFGEENPEPVLLMENAMIKEIITLSMGKHLKLILQSGSRIFECVWWGKGEAKDFIEFDMKIDVAFKMSLNSWNGKERLQLVVEDIKPSNLKN